MGFLVSFDGTNMMKILVVVTVVLTNLFCLSQAGEVCYPLFGCFNDEPPFNNALTQLPWHPDDVETKFFLYTRKTQEKPERLSTYFKKTASYSHFNPNASTVIFTHGYIEHGGRWYVPKLKDELLKLEDMNVIFVEWKKGAFFPYHQAFGNARLVGRQIAYLLRVMRNDTGVNWDKIRIVGFSLGAHVVGYAGEALRKAGMLVPRITGLDPAAPYYENTHIDVRLDPTDADLVDVWHTDGKTILIHGFGTIQRMGHIDFFPNGGFHQPGCGKLDIDVVQYFACSHYRAVRYYIESINNACPYYAYPCESWKKFDQDQCTKCPDEGCQAMSYHLKKPKKHVDRAFYLDTFTQFPFCGFHYEFTFYTNDAFLADLNAVVVVELFGEKNSEVLRLPHKYYESGRTISMVTLGTKDLGKLKNMKIKFEAILDAWYLRALMIKPMYSQIEYTACYGIWLNSYKNKRDFKIDYNPLNCPIAHPS